MEVINLETLAMLKELDAELAKAYAERCLNAPEPSQKEKEADKQTFVFHDGNQTVNVNCNFIEGKSSNRKTSSSSNASSNVSSSSNKPGNPAPPSSDPTPPPPPLDLNEAEALNEDVDNVDDEVDEAGETEVSINNDDLDAVPDFIT